MFIDFVFVFKDQTKFLFMFMYSFCFYLHHVNGDFFFMLSNYHVFITDAISRVKKYLSNNHKGER